MPGIIGERLFDLFDLNCDGYLDLTEFATNSLKIYSTDFKIIMKLVFDLYDFGREGAISKEDVRLLLSHAPISKVSAASASEGQLTQSGGGTEQYTDRLESQRELDELLDISFGKAEKLSFEGFRHTTEKVSSEMFLCIFSLVKTRFPCIDQFKRYELRLRANTDSLLRSPTAKRKLPSPKVLSRFANLSGIVKRASPKHRKFTEEEKAGFSEKPIIKLFSATGSSDASTQENAAASPIGTAGNQSPGEDTFTKRLEATDFLFCACGSPIADYNKLLCAGCLDKLTNCEGYLHKKGKKGVKKCWVSIEKRELFRSVWVMVEYEDKAAVSHEKMHSLVECFVKEGVAEEVGGRVMYPFALIFSSAKKKEFYAETEADYKTWISYLKKATRYANILDYYTLKVSPHAQL